MELISRADAIKDAESWVAVDEHERHLQKNVIEWLKEFPTAELSTNLAEVGTDCISRQAAIEAVEFGITYAKAINKETGEVTVLFEESNAELREAADRIKQLPPADPTEHCEQCMMEHMDNMEKLEVELAQAKMQLPPAQPALCEDAVSRKAVAGIYTALWETIGTIMDRDEWDDVCKATANELPPAQPERIKAKWLPIGMADAVGGESAMWGDEIAYHACDNCWQQALEKDGEEVLSDFCPCCGADMRQREE